MGSRCTLLSVITAQSYNVPILGGVCDHIDPCAMFEIIRINKKVIRGLGSRSGMVATAEVGGLVNGVVRVRSSSSSCVYSLMSSL